MASRHEGPRAPRLPVPPSLEDALTGTDKQATVEMSDSDASSDNIHEGNFRAELRRNALSPQEQEEVFAQWHDDSRWANVSLCPLFHGEETPEEIQWEQERLHGDLNLYRRSWVPTPKYLAWKAAQDKLVAEQELARTEAIQSADEISMTSSATSDSEPNWYFTHTDEGQRLLMWRPAYGKQLGGGDAYVPLDVDRSALIDPGATDQDPPPLKFEWMGEDVQDIVDIYLNNEKGAMERVLRDESKAREQMQKRSPQEAESLRLVEHFSTAGHVAAADDEIWSRARELGLFTRDHGISSEDISSQIVELRRRWFEQRETANCAGGEEGQGEGQGEDESCVRLCAGDSLGDALLRSCGVRDGLMTVRGAGRNMSPQALCRVSLPEGKCLLAGHASVDTAGCDAAEADGGSRRASAAGSDCGGELQLPLRNGAGTTSTAAGEKGGVGRGDGGDGSELRREDDEKTSTGEEGRGRGGWRYHVAGCADPSREGSVVLGRWRMGPAAQGTFSFVNTELRPPPQALEAFSAPHTPIAAFTVEGGPWSLEGCSFRCAGALSLRARLSARLALRCCFIGGLGPLAERACDGLVARGNASLSVFNSSVGACMFAGLRAHEAAVVKVFHSSVSQCGLALGFYGNSLIGFYNSSAGNLSTSAALHTEPTFTRTARGELIDSTFVVRRLWCSDGPPEYGYDKVPKLRRCLQRRVRLVVPRALASGRVQDFPDRQGSDRPGRLVAGSHGLAHPVHIDLALDARSRLASATQLARNAGSLVNRSLAVKGHDGGRRAGEEESERTSEATASATGVYQDRRRHPMSLTRAQVEMERKAKRVFPGSTMVGNRSLGDWRSNEDSEIEEEARLAKERQQEEDWLLRARKMDWNTIRIEADVGNVKAQLGLVRNLMKDGVIQGDVLDPFSWRLTGSKSGPDSPSPEQQRMAAFLPELSPAALRRFRCEWHPGSPAYEAVARELHKSRGDGARSKSAGGACTSSSRSSSGGSLSHESGPEEGASDESGDEQRRAGPSPMRRRSEDVDLSSEGRIDVHGASKRHSTSVVQKGSLVGYDLENGPNLSSRLRGGSEGSFPAALKRARGNAQGDVQVAGNRSPDFGMRAGAKQVVRRHAPTALSQSSAAAHAGASKHSEEPPEPLEEGFMFTAQHLPWGSGREHWHAPIPHYDILKRQFVAELHQEDISPLNLTVAEREREAAKWLVLLDPCTDDIYYANEETWETRWNLPRGLRYVDLHSRNRTAHLCHIVVPDHLSLGVRNIDWEHLMQQGRESGDWAAYRQQRTAFMDEVRATLLSAAPHTRVYIKLAQPYCFEGEAVCDPPHEIDPGLPPQSPAA